MSAGSLVRRSPVSSHVLCGGDGQGHGSLLGAAPACHGTTTRQPPSAGGRADRPRKYRWGRSMRLGEFWFTL
eukprot:SAG25_NODE_257_length_10931_cov_4.550960_5_plen_72_part_00